MFLLYYPERRARLSEFDGALHFKFIEQSFGDSDLRFETRDEAFSFCDTMRNDILSRVWKTADKNHWNRQLCLVEELEVLKY